MEKKKDVCATERTIGFLGFRPCRKGTSTSRAWRRFPFPEKYQKSSNRVGANCCRQSIATLGDVWRTSILTLDIDCMEVGWSVCRLVDLVGLEERLVGWLVESEDGPIPGPYSLVLYGREVKAFTVRAWVIQSADTMI